MKVVILAGGTKSTISNEAEGIPKPMTEIGEKPVLWHIMKTFSVYGYKDFIICGGYKVNMIKDYFMDFYIYQSDITVNLQDNSIIVHKNKTENWNVTVVDTGIDTTPSGRVLHVKDYLGTEDFIVVHGDCLSNMNIEKLVNAHRHTKRIATVAVAKPTGRNKILKMDEKGMLVETATSEVHDDLAWVNACYEVFTSDIFAYLSRSEDVSDKLFEQLASDKQIGTYKHEGFWSPIETRRDMVLLEKLWNESKAPWKIW